MARQKKVVEIEANPNFPVPTEVGFTGVARTIVCYKHNGWTNYRIATITIEDGKVAKVNYSDPYANFEVIQKLELANDYANMRLNANWQDGRAWFLNKDANGKDIQDGLSG